MAALDTIVDRVKDLAGVNASEGFDSKLAGWVNEAVAQHDSSFDVTTLPSEQYEAVALLAALQVLYIRAAKFSREANQQSSAGGFGTDRNTPFQKTMALIEKFETRYSNIVADSSDGSAEGSIIQGELVRQSDRTGRIESPNVLPVRLTLVSSNVTAASAVLRWYMRYNAQFADFFLYSSLEAGIYQDWRVNTSDGVPSISAAATRIAKIGNQEIRSVKVEDLDPDTVYYFLLVMRSLANRYYYSQEITVATPSS